MRRRAITLLPLVGLAPPASGTSPPRVVIAVEVRLPSSRAAEWVAEEITLPFERSFSKLAGLASMTSTSSHTYCSIELGYAGSPSPEALSEVRSVALATWRALKVSVPEPSVSVREAQFP
jgi:multidrug efflux pump subunit AcrB